MARKTRATKTKTLEQRRIGARARELGIPAIFPGLYEDDDGEVFVQRRRNLACFSCWDSFRLETETMRGVTALNVDTLPVLFLAVELSLGLLDINSIYFRRLVARRGSLPPVLYRLTVRDELALGTPQVDRRSNCPVCGSTGVAQGSSATTARATARAAAPGSTRTRPPNLRIARAVNIAIAMCAIFAGVLLMNAVKAMERHDVVGGQSAGHYFGEAALAILAFFLMAGGAWVVLRELVAAVTGRSPYGA
jgi:hypothetical protein